jgi:sarcosine oxidase
MIRPVGCVVSGPKAALWAAAMEQAGLPGELVEGTSGRLRLPARTMPSEALIDDAGGVIDVDEVRAHLTALAGGSVVHEPVYALEEAASGAVVWTPSGRAGFDVVLVAAGAGTSPLAAQVGVYTPTALAHAVRFGFPAPPSADWPCWIDTPAEGLGTYQHRTGRGMWSIGAHLDPVDTAWEVGPEQACAAHEEAVLRYVRDQLVVEPRVVERLYCVSSPNSDDGFTVRRSGSVLAVYGDNLFKFAPILGEALAAACCDGSTPAGSGTPAISV